MLLLEEPQCACKIHSSRSCCRGVPLTGTNKLPCVVVQSLMLSKTTSRLSLLPTTCHPAWLCLLLRTLCSHPLIKTESHHDHSNSRLCQTHADAACRTGRFDPHSIQTDHSSQSVKKNDVAVDGPCSQPLWSGFILPQCLLHPANPGSEQPKCPVHASHSSDQAPPDSRQRKPYTQHNTPTLTAQVRLCPHPNPIPTTSALHPNMLR